MRGYVATERGSSVLILAQAVDGPDINSWMSKKRVFQQEGLKQILFYIVTGVHVPVAMKVTTWQSGKDHQRNVGRLTDGQSVHCVFVPF